MACMPKKCKGNNKKSSSKKSGKKCGSKKKKPCQITYTNSDSTQGT